MAEYVLQQTDGIPVRFSGTMLAEKPAPVDPPPFSRWHEIRIYKSDKGRYVLEIVFQSLAVNTDKHRIEPEQHDIFVCETADDVMEELNEYDPLAFVIGFPEGIDKSEQKNERLRQRVSTTYRASIGEVLTQAARNDPSFAEEV